MRRFKFSKLVRDKIVDAITSHGNIPHWKVLTDSEYILELKKKIIEEAPELLNATGAEVVEELADLQEIIDNLLVALNIPKDELKKAQEKKNQQRGSFKSKHYIEEVDAQDGASEIDYYLKFPEKYPEVKA